MTITVRLYRHSDLDLMLLCGAYGKRFARFASECVKSYIRNIPPYLAGVPDIEFVEDHDDIVSSKYVGLSFSSREDGDVLDFLKNNIRYGYRNNFIKNILRLYAGKICIAAYCSTKAGYDRLKQSGVLPSYTGTPVSVPPIIQNNYPTQHTPARPPKRTVQKSAAVSESTKVNIEPPMEETQFAPDIGSTNTEASIKNNNDEIFGAFSRILGGG